MKRRATRRNSHESPTLAGVGVDICEPTRIARSIRNRRFIDKVFTPAEIAYCESFRSSKVLRYAARFAAKEAAFKALGVPGDIGISWTEIEVVSKKGHPPVLKLHGKAAAIAKKRRIVSFLLSLSHVESAAVAMVAAVVG